jgi:transposase
MGKRMSPEEIESRRARAVKLFKSGFSQAEVARRLKVSRQSAMRWKRTYESGGAEALRSRKRGRPARLSEEQLNQFEKALMQGPKAHGWSSEIWTLERIGIVLRRLHGVSYHTGHLWRVLGSMGWSPQRPATRARERDEDAIEGWKKRGWPRLKKTPVGRPTSFS